ncbi:MAG: hypothetical protein IJL36_02215 [Clostridia bacterium]|nr:hypothetical protein [Clostridia bacterium]MBQ6383484.1 hypothetical protein [Clostridia bacterium]MBQ9402735.1 hypothetical protein [Clostridia bacterium]
MRFDLPDLKLAPMPEWEARRREWIALAEDCLYGHAPEAAPVRGEVLETEILWDGKGRRETVRICYGPDFGYSFDAVLMVPADPGPHPAVTWNQFSARDWESCPCEEAVTRYGFIIAGFEREQAAEDKPDGRRPACEAYPGYDWGGVRIWAWAQSRLADYLLTREDVDPGRLVCTGFSRGGKAALACGIFDERYAVCAPVCSGAGGCGCFRYLGDENGFCQDVTKVEGLGRIGSVFPYWWTESFSRWWPKPDPTQMGLEQDFPLDSHTLKALIAPRTLFSLEGIGDAWSNPRGTALTWRAAQPAFDLLGGTNIARFKPGGHAFGPEDWRCLLDFCLEAFSGKPVFGDWSNNPFDLTR